MGAVWGHLLIGMGLTMLLMFGIVALAGVVVNDSQVLVDFINPILLTFLTIFLSLLPLLLERSLQAPLLMPMAVSLSFGVAFATFITLMLVPAGCLIAEDVRAAATGGWRRPPAPDAGAPVAPRLRGS